MLPLGLIAFPYRLRSLLPYFPYEYLIIIVYFPLLRKKSTFTYYSENHVWFSQSCRLEANGLVSLGENVINA